MRGFELTGCSDTKALKGSRGGGGGRGASGLVISTASSPSSMRLELPDRFMAIEERVDKGRGKEEDVEVFGVSGGSEVEGDLSSERAMISILTIPSSATGDGDEDDGMFSGSDGGEDNDFPSTADTGTTTVSGLDAEFLTC